MTLDTLTIATICLIVSFFLAEIFHRIKYPQVLGQILAGIILGLPLFAFLFTPNIIIDIEFLADLGVIFMLLLVGLELNIEKFKRAGKDTITIALFCTLTPFILGFVTIRALGYSTLVAFVVGAAFSLTAEGTKLKVLLDLKALNTKLGIIMLGAGILDDVFEVLFLSLLLILSNGSFATVIWLPVKVIVFALFIFFTYKLFPYFLHKVQKERSRTTLFSFVLIFALLVAVVSKKFELGPILGAFIAGIIIHLSEHRKSEYKEIITELNAMTFSFIIPFFFINIGLKFDITSLTSNLWLTLLIIFVATAGKIIGALLATPFTDLSLKQTHLVGWGMNSRGAIELVIATFAYSNGMIPLEIYSAVVMMALVTTLTFPIVMKQIIMKDRAILK